MIMCIDNNNFGCINPSILYTYLCIPQLIMLATVNSLASYEAHN